MPPTDSSNAIPRHLRRPGDEGYRTPTIEDSHGPNATCFPFQRSGNESYIRASSSPNPRQRSPEQGNGHSRRTTSANAQPSHLPDNDDELATRLPWRVRLKHLTWAYFTFTMATGGIANVLYTVPYRFSGLTIIGDMFFLGNIFAYFALWVLISLRFYFHPHTFKASLLHPTESLFVPAAAVSFGTILINISQYGLAHVGPWLNHVVEVLYWFDATLAVVLSVLVYLLLWSTQYFSVSRMTPIWIFPAYPLLIIGPHAGILSSQLNPNRALPVVVAGFTIQGVGFLVSLMVYSAFIYRLMTQKLPRESLRPGMFVSVGPAGFTVAGVVNMAESTKRIIPAMFEDEASGQLTATILKVCADWMSLWLWGLAIWFFLVSVLAHLTTFLPQTDDNVKDYSSAPDQKRPNSRGSPHRFQKPRMAFSMTFFSFIFPNTALVTATFAIGKAFDVHTIKVLGCVMTCILILAWIGVVIGMIRAIRNHVILWPERGEDRDEGGFRMKDQEQKSMTYEDGDMGNDGSLELGGGHGLSRRRRFSQVFRTNTRE